MIIFQEGSHNGLVQAVRARKRVFLSQALQDVQVSPTYSYWTLRSSQLRASDHVKQPRHLHHVFFEMHAQGKVLAAYSPSNFFTANSTAFRLQAANLLFDSVWDFSVMVLFYHQCSGADFEFKYFS